MTKKGRQFFSEKNRGDTLQLPSRVTPTLVTPLADAQVQFSTACM